MRSALVLGLSVLVSTGCVGVQSRVVVPRCVERVELSGEHTRVGEDTFVFNHALDLPFSRTAVTVERTDGTKETVEITNVLPDAFHLVGAGLVGSISLLLVGMYAYQVGVAGEEILGETMWAAPIGAFGLFFASTLAVTGWHPLSEETVVETACGAP